MRILGIDPGIANTGLAIVERKNHTYTLLFWLLLVIFFAFSEAFE